MTESFGMMDGAYFVGKNDLLKWINGTYQLNMNKIEQACTGAIYCQIIDSIHPGKVKMHKVNWKAKLEHEFINNFKILQQAFTDCKISKHIEVSKLTKGKYQDNLEFMQWMKRYFDDRKITAEYDPVQRRNGCDLEYLNENTNSLNAGKKRDNSKNHYPSSSGMNSLKSGKSEKNLNNITALKKEEAIKQKENVNTGTAKQEEKIEEIQNENCPREEIPLNVETKVCSSEKNGHNENYLNEATETLRAHYQERLDIANDEISKQKIEVNTLKMSISEIGRERDFYFSKLRDFEMLVVKNPDLSKEELMNLMKTILYSEREVELQFDENRRVNLKNH